MRECQYIVAFTVMHSGVQISGVVGEQELGLRQMLRTMGMLDSSYWLSWMLFEVNTPSLCVTRQSAACCRNVAHFLGALYVAIEAKNVFAEDVLTDDGIPFASPLSCHGQPPDWWGGFLPQQDNMVMATFGKTTNMVMATSGKTTNMVMATFGKSTNTASR